ncbi:hypothetical protein EU642_22265 [Salmonella enterica]|nr:hypothetical protein [Salmonella enterica]EAO0118579.1 hypothetical protein [Salmonella enterica]EAO3601682.1 hypothetical protein [Salmonella enterica]EAR6391577.1 hypothetical protein [Salmonella enterica]EAV1285341.1 hypothetical protein [Salmonella enterica]
MPTTTADFKSLDYFDLARLNGKPAVYDLDGESSFTCEGVRYVVATENLSYRDVSVKHGAPLADAIMSERMSAEGMKLHEHGVVKLMNLSDKHWVFVFLAPPRTACLLSAGTFDETLEGI